MILIIDNYDSFVYNIARYVESTGHETQVIRNDKITINQIENLKPSHIIISPGPGEPKSAGISIDLIKYFYTKLPVLGICLGHQAIGYAFGSNIIKAKHPMHGKASFIYHNNNYIFNKLKSPISCGRYHSLIIDAINDNSELEVIASSIENEIMAIKHKIYPTFGVQFHPESILTEYGIDIINNFVQINFIG